jgi:hypothetical protein
MLQGLFARSSFRVRETDEADYSWLRDAQPATARLIRRPTFADGSRPFKCIFAN